MTHVICSHCDYGWEYGGELLYATCPCCRTKTAVDDGDAPDVPTDN